MPEMIICLCRGWDDNTDCRSSCPAHGSLFEQLQAAQRRIKLLETQLTVKQGEQKQGVRP